MSQALQNVDKIQFCVDTLVVKDGRRLGRIRPDADGYYEMPLAVLGTVTDNRTYYEVEDFVAQLTSPTSFINKALTSGSLKGELGHPMIVELQEDQRLPRLMVIDEQKVSHHIKQIRTGEKLASGGRILYGKIKPCGPYKDAVQDAFDDPTVNAAFSLRSIAHSRQEGTITRRKIKHLVTFDYVSLGGYSEASKWYAPGIEAIDMSLESFALPVTTAAMEHFTDTEINEIFGAKTVMIGSTRTTLVDRSNALRTSDGKLHSVYTSLMGKKA